MKVLMVNVVCGIKSTGRICTDLADILIEQGNQIKIAYGREAAPEKYGEIAFRVGKKLDVISHIAKSLLFDSCGFESKSVTLQLIEKINEYNPDIIHLHNLHGYYLNVEVLFQYLKICKKRIIWTLHDCWAFTGHCSYFTMAECEQWKTHCSYCSQIIGYPKCILAGNVSKNFEKKRELFTDIPNMVIVTPSDWLANQVRESFLKKYPIIAIPNGIDMKQFKPTVSSFRKKHHLEDKKIILGVATAWGERKGLEEFKKLAEQLNSSYKIVLVGLNNKQIKRLPNSMIKIEKTNSTSELAAIYTAADVFLNLGKEETMGLTTVEAMACGTPVLVSNMTAVPEVVEEQGGLILDNLEIDTIINGIEKVLMKKYFATRDNAEKYEKNRQYGKYIDLYMSDEVYH